MEFEIIIEENPISRCYINILKENNIKLKNIIILDGKWFIPNFVALNLSFNKNNYWPLSFLKEKNFLNLTHQIEDYFNFPRNFCTKMYRFKNIYDVSEKIIFTKNKNINSKDSINIIKESTNILFLNTGKQIYKNVLELNKKFVHIHPGYLPEVRGADGSLWHINQNNNLGVSSFFMNQKIDEGLVIEKEKLPLPKFSLPNYKELNIKILYRLWFSFFDPLLRGWHFKKLIKEGNISINRYKKNKDNAIETQNSKYFSFMSEDKLKETFDKVFIK